MTAGAPSEDDMKKWIKDENGSLHQNQHFKDATKVSTDVLAAREQAATDGKITMDNATKVATVMINLDIVCEDDSKVKIEKFTWNIVQDPADWNMTAHWVANKSCGFYIFIFFKSSKKNNNFFPSLSCSNHLFSRCVF